jgi:uncharacterized protein YcfL
MKKYIFVLSSAFIFLLASCGGSESQNESSEELMIQEEKIATEVEKSSENAKKQAEETEKEVEKLLEDI